MKLRFRRLETNETLNLEFADACTLHDLRLKINESTPSSVHLSLNRKDELFAPSPKATLRSLGVKSGEIIYYSLNPYDFTALDHEMGSTSPAEIQKTQAPVAESSDGKLTENATRVQESSEASVLDNVVTEGPEPKDLAGVKRLSEPLFLKKILLEESSETSELTIVVMSVHAVMLESGFSLFEPDSGIRFSFSEELLSIPLKYTVPALIIGNKPPNRIESVSLKFQRLGHMVVVYGSLDAGGSVRRACFDKRGYVPIVNLLLMETLESEKEDTLSIHRAVYMFWVRIKDGFVTPLLIDLCYRTGLELPPCLMRLPPELKRKILESLPGVDIARLACLSTELRDLASDNDLWKQKCLEEC